MFLIHTYLLETALALLDSPFEEKHERTISTREMGRPCSFVYE